VSRYVDGFLLAVPTEKLEEYRRMAAEARDVWLEYGALDYVECFADDVKPGEVTSFPQAVKLEPHETVVFSWILYESREHRDRVNEQVLRDPRMNSYDPAALPFDGQRMMWGGFRVFVSPG
jgi:uncharacterized protein YbaA (DUF1428 family)